MLRRPGPIVQEGGDGGVAGESGMYVSVAHFLHRRRIDRCFLCLLSTSLLARWVLVGRMDTGGS